MDSSKHKDASGGEDSKEVESGEAESNVDAASAPPSSAPSSQSHGDVGVSGSEGGSSSSSSSSSNRSSGVGGGSLSSTGMGNPFARAAPQGTWSSESEQRPILAPPRLSPASDTVGMKVSSSSSTGGGVLRPSALAAGRLGGPVRAPGSFFPPPALTVTASSPPQPTKTEFKLKPSVLSSSGNPFARSMRESESKSDAESGSSEPDKAATEQRLPSTMASREDKSQSDSHTPPSSSQTDSKAASNKANTSSNLFLPLGNGNDSSSSPTIARNSFIFGHNLQSKITAGGGSSGSGASGGWGVSSSSSDPSETTNGEKPTGNLFSEAASEVSRWTEGGSIGASATTNGQPHTGNLFTDAASGITQTQDRDGWRGGQSLEESSREITEKEKSQKRKFDEVEVITGEENESNVLQMNCKLYAWVSGWWQERGRGILRLNDWDAGQEIRSRLVIRTQGTLTVMLNTKVWAEMSVERASSKSVRFTALDADGQPKIFLAMGSPKDVDLLYNSLEWRVATSRAQTHDDAASDANKKTKTEDDAKAASVTSHTV